MHGVWKHLPIQPETLVVHLMCYPIQEKCFTVRDFESEKSELPCMPHAHTSSAASPCGILVSVSSAVGTSAGSTMLFCGHRKVRIDKVYGSTSKIKYEFTQVKLNMYFNKQNTRGIHENILRCAKHHLMSIIRSNSSWLCMWAAIFAFSGSTYLI